MLEDKLRALDSGLQPRFGRNPLHELAVAGDCEHLYRGGPRLPTVPMPELVKVEKERERLRGEIEAAAEALKDWRTSRPAGASLGGRA